MAVTRAPRDAGLLAALAEPLKPQRSPFYMRSSDSAPDGWYWKPAGVDRVEWLGRNVLWAERRLLELGRGHGGAS